MNPTFNLSAAEAPLLIVPASSSAAAAAKSVFFITNLQTVGGNVSPERRAPSRTSGIGKSAVGHEHGAQRGGRGRTAGTGARQQHQNDDGREIGQRRHELRRNSD